ncbi:hypothetical protein ACQY0O_004832 [Thecaphora frezii]
MRYLRLLVLLYATCLLFFLHASSASLGGGSWWDSLTGTAETHLRQASEPLLGASSSTSRSRNVGRVNTWITQLRQQSHLAAEERTLVNDFKAQLQPFYVELWQAGEKVESVRKEYMAQGKEIILRTKLPAALEVWDKALRKRRILYDHAPDPKKRLILRAMEELRSRPSGSSTGLEEALILSETYLVAAWKTNNLNEQEMKQITDLLVEVYQMNRERVEKGVRDPLELYSPYGETLEEITTIHHVLQEHPPGSTPYNEAEKSFNLPKYQQTVKSLDEDIQTFKKIASQTFSINEPIAESDNQWVSLFKTFVKTIQDSNVDPAQTNPLEGLRAILLKLQKEREFFKAELEYRYESILKKIGQGKQGPGHSSSSS